MIVDAAWYVEVRRTVDRRARPRRAPPLHNALQASRAGAERQQHEDIRTISAWAASGIVPTIVAGLFWTSLGGVALVEHRTGFAVVSGLTVLVCVLHATQFNQTGWL